VTWDDFSVGTKTKHAISGFSLNSNAFFTRHRVMAARVTRLSSLFSSEYARRINAQIVYPAKSVVVKPNELESALSRPVNVSNYEPHRAAPYLAASLSYGIIKGHPFMDGNKRTSLTKVKLYASILIYHQPSF
jgi:hypothetical protein